MSVPNRNLVGGGCEFSSSSWEWNTCQCTIMLPATSRVVPCVKAPAFHGRAKVREVTRRNLSKKLQWKKGKRITKAAATDVC